MKASYYYTIPFTLLLWVKANNALSSPSKSALSSSSSSSVDNHKIKAAVLVPGFLTGQDEFRSLAQALNDRGIPTYPVPMPNWHWIPCLGGRSMRPILERLDFAVQHVVAALSSSNNNNATATIQIPPYDYSILDCWGDFWDNPGGINQVGGSDRVEEYPVVLPRGRFPLPNASDNNNKNVKIALIGHSAGGWISRIYLSQRNYGGRVYDGSKHVHSLVTLGTPHAIAPGPAFEGIRWCNDENKDDLKTIRKLAVGGKGFLGTAWGALTQGSYAFCSEPGTDLEDMDGDGITPIESALAWDDAEHLVLDGATTHFCWSEVFGSSLVAPELLEDQVTNQRPWYGTDSVLDQWAGFLEESM